MPGTPLKKIIVASRQRPPPYGCACSEYSKCSEIWGVETSTIQSGSGAIGLSGVWTYDRAYAGPEFCRWQRGNGGGAKLVKGHAKKLFSRGHLQACGQVDQVCCEAGGTMCVVKQGDHVCCEAGGLCVLWSRGTMCVVKQVDQMCCEAGGLCVLWSRWTKCVEKQGDYVEK